MIDKIPNEAQSFINSGATVIYVTVDHKFVGYLVLSDQIRVESKKMIEDVQSLSVEPVLLTGDNQMVANSIGNSLAIREIYAQCLPEDKLEQIASYRKQGEAVCMIGDGCKRCTCFEKS